jgi:hypothetical protein
MVLYIQLYIFRDSDSIATCQALREAKNVGFTNIYECIAFCVKPSNEPKITRAMSAYQSVKE